MLPFVYIIKFIIRPQKGLLLLLAVYFNYLRVKYVCNDLMKYKIDLFIKKYEEMANKQLKPIKIILIALLRFGRLLNKLGIKSKKQ